MKCLSYLIRRNGFKVNPLPRRILIFPAVQRNSEGHQEQVYQFLTLLAVRLNTCLLKELLKYHFVTVNLIKLTSGVILF